MMVITKFHGYPNIYKEISLTTTNVIVRIGKVIRTQHRGTMNVVVKMFCQYKEEC